MRKLTISILFTIVLLPLLLAACGGGASTEAGEASPGASGEAPVATTQANDASSDGSAAQGEPPASTEAPATTTTAEPVDETPFIGLPNAGSVTQTTPIDGNQARPTLVWEPVDGAAEYAVVVFHGSGEAWWSWYGPETEVVLGGVASAAMVGGPRAGDGVTWAVVGYDDAGTALAASPRRPIEA